MSPKLSEEDMLFLNPPITIKQDWKHYTNILLIKYNYILTGEYKAYKTTTHWTGIMFAQKNRWNMKV